MWTATRSNVLTQLNTTVNASSSPEQLAYLAQAWRDMVLLVGDAPKIS